MKNEFKIQKDIFRNQVLKRLKQKGIWNTKGDKPDFKKLYGLLFPEETEILANDIERVRKWINAENFIQTPQLIKLCEILDCDIHYLFTENAETPNRDINYLCQTYNINRESSENLLAITKDKAAVEMLNIILSDRESLINFLQNLYDIKNNRDIDKRIMISKVNSESKVIDLEEIEKETGETIPLKYGISIKDAIKGNALNNINRIIDQWTKKEGD